MLDFIQHHNHWVILPIESKTFSNFINSNKKMGFFYLTKLQSLHIKSEIPSLYPSNLYSDVGYCF